MEQLIEGIILALDDEATLRQLVIWLAAISAFVLVLGSAIILNTWFNPVKRRVDALAGDDDDGGAAIMVRLAGAMGPVSSYVLPQDQDERNSVNLKLTRAGFRSPIAIQVFYFVKTLLIIGLPLLVLAAGTFLPDLSTKDIILYSIFASGIGMLLPNMVLHRLLQKRMRTLTNGFPDALDLLVVCVESGLGLAAAIQRVADELSVSHPELALEFALVNAEIRVGVQRDAALKNLAHRTGLEDIRGLVGLLAQTMKFGTGIADALRVYSEEFRDKRMQAAEEQAAKMGTKLVFPLVLFMFPIFFIVAVGPAVLRIIDAFNMT